MPPFNVTEEAMAGTNRMFERLRLAKELDPQAFEPFHVPHWTEEQRERQRQAEERVIAEHPELAPSYSVPRGLTMRPQ